VQSVLEQRRPQTPKRFKAHLTRHISSSSYVNVYNTSNSLASQNRFDQFLAWSRVSMYCSPNTIPVHSVTLVRSDLSAMHDCPSILKVCAMIQVGAK